MQTCVVRPVLPKKVNDIDFNEFTKLSEALPDIKIVFDFSINLKKFIQELFRFRKDNIFKKDYI